MEKVMHTNIRLQGENIAILKSIFGNATAGSTMAVESWIELRKRTLIELVGLFDENELYGIIDNLNGHIPDVKFLCTNEMLWWHLSDGEKYEYLFSRWGIDQESFKKKVDALTSAQTFFIQNEILNWWKLQDKSLDEFVKLFLHK